jgi:hypothetical protein
MMIENLRYWWAGLLIFWSWHQTNRIVERGCRAWLRR